MRSRGLLAALAVVALAALALGRGKSPRPSPSRPGAAAMPSRLVALEPSAPPPDPEGIRDVFRFATETGPGASVHAAHGAPSATTSPTPPPTGPRLVGLVRRSGRLVAALVADGEVALAGPGESAAGVSVLSVGEDGVRVRHPDGHEETLVLP